MILCWCLTLESVWDEYLCVLFFRRQVEWEAASSLIEGICLTLHRQPIISFLPHLRSLINVCVNLVSPKHLLPMRSFVWCIFVYIKMYVFRWWGLWGHLVWQMDFPCCIWVHTCLLLFPSVQQLCVWLPCRSRYNLFLSIDISNMHFSSLIYFWVYV